MHATQGHDACYISDSKQSLALNMLLTGSAPDTTVQIPEGALHLRDLYIIRLGNYKSQIVQVYFICKSILFISYHVTSYESCTTGDYLVTGFVVAFDTHSLPIVHRCSKV